MKYLIIYAHPNPQSFNHAILETVQQKLKKDGKSYETRDLSALKFNPILAGSDFVAFKQGQIPPDIKQEQDYIRQADVLIFIYPIWWFGMPAQLKGYIDRVFSFGFAYAVNEKGPYGLLTDKKVIILNTTGGAAEDYEKFGFNAALKTTTATGVFEFCGMKVLQHKFLYGVPYVTQEDRKAMLERLNQLAI